MSNLFLDNQNSKTLIFVILLILCLTIIYYFIECKYRKQNIGKILYQWLFLKEN